MKTESYSVFLIFSNVILNDLQMIINAFKNLFIGVFKTNSLQIDFRFVFRSYVCRFLDLD